MWAPIVPVPEVMKHVAEHYPRQMAGYLRVFFKQEPRPEEFKKVAAGFQMPEDDVIARLDEAGIESTLITGFDEWTSAHETFIPNDLVAGLAERHPDRFIPFAGVDLLLGMDAVRELERLVRDRGFRGLSLRPFMIGLPADDRRYYPLYSKCVELDVPLSIHTSANWTTVASNDLGHPRHIDLVAADFPDLKIIMSHAGYPWVLEAVLLAWKYPNVYLELAAHRPRYMAVPGTGWEPLLRFGPRTIREKVLFGTGWFLLGRPPAQLIEEFRTLPIPDDVMQLWLGDNARALLGDQAASSSATA
jgi:uncharacterized protein